MEQWNIHRNNNDAALIQIIYYADCVWMNLQITFKNLYAWIHSIILNRYLLLEIKYYSILKTPFNYFITSNVNSSLYIKILLLWLYLLLTIPMIVSLPLQTWLNWLWKPEEVECSLQSPECFQCGWEGTGTHQTSGPWRWVAAVSSKTLDFVQVTLTGWCCWISTKLLLVLTGGWLLGAWRISGVNCGWYH